MTLPRRGRPGLVLNMIVERELTPLDLIDLQIRDDFPKIGTAPIQRLKSSHHAVARHLASGRTVQETALLTGYTPQRVSDLGLDPAFQDLLAYYEIQVDEIGIDDAQRFQLKLKDVGEAALDLIDDRVNDPVKSATIPIGELRQIVTMAADRTVAPPKQAQTATVIPAKITFNMGPREIAPKVIEGEGHEIHEIEIQKDD